MTEYQLRTLVFLKNEVWATLKAISFFFNGAISNTKKHLMALEKKGFIKIVKYHWAGDRRYVQICYLTTKGASLVCTVDEYKKYRIFNVKMISESSFLHSEDCQILHCQSIMNNFVSWKRGDLLLREKNIHYPDAIAVDSKNEKIVVEVERTIKSYKRYENIFGQYVIMLDQKKADKIIYASYDNLIVSNLSKIFYSIKSFNFRNKNFYCPNELRKRFFFTNYNQFFDSY